MRPVLTLLLVCMLSGFVSVTDAEQLHTILFADGDTTDLVPADFNGDGFPDILYGFVNYDTWIKTVVVMQNTGNGTFSEHEILQLENATGSLSAIDMDFDGDLDIFCNQNSGPDAEFFWLKNEGGFTYSYQLLDFEPPHSPSLAPCDFDFDGDMDFASTDCRWTGVEYERRLRLFRSIGGNGTYDTVELGSWHNSDNFGGNAVWRDFDGDGYEDLYFTAAPDDLREGYIFWNDDGEFYSDAQYLMQYADEGFAIFGDIDNDSRIDVLDDPIGSFHARLQTIPRQFEATMLQDEDGYVLAVAVDYNVDGHTDFIGNTYFGNPELICFENDGTQHYTPTVLNELNVWIDAVADLDNDGDPDLLYTTYSASSSSLIWVENSTLTSSVEQGNPLSQFELAVNVYPNPFNTSATISLNLPHPCPVNLTLVNTLGQVVWTRPNVQAGTGLQQFSMDGSTLTSGTYLLTVITETEHASRKLVIVK